MLILLVALLIIIAGILILMLIFNHEITCALDRDPAAKSRLEVLLLYSKVE